VFGFLGLFAMHHARLGTPPRARRPSTGSRTSSQDPTDVRGWGLALDRWASGVGVVAGTVEGGTVLNIKGMLVLELPGPRVLLLVKANLLKKRPPTKGTYHRHHLRRCRHHAAAGAHRAAVRLSHRGGARSHRAGGGRLLLRSAGLPARALHVDAGTIARPATAKVLARGHRVFHGARRRHPRLPAAGFSLATGLRVSFTWGNTDVGLYLRVSAGFDVGVGFAPFFFAGRVFLDGKLRLFIVSIEAHGNLKFLSDGEDSRLEGRICGKVSFFFFSVKGCVGFSLGDMPGAPFPPSPIRDLMLQSRSPALVEGTGVDRGIDSVLCHGTENGSVPTVEVREGDNVVQREVFVPIDAIPLVQFRSGPERASGATIDGHCHLGPPGFGQGWQVWAELPEVRDQLDRAAARAIGGAPVPPEPLRRPTAPPVPGGIRSRSEAMACWWSLPARLKPTNVDKAMLQSPGLDGMVDDRFGMCARKLPRRRAFCGPSAARRSARPNPGIHRRGVARSTRQQSAPSPSTRA
jgi:hypothetical protein